MLAYTTTFSTAFGLFSLAVDASGAVIATAFGDALALQSRLWPRGPAASDVLVPDGHRTAPAQQQLLAYFAGTRTAFDVPLAPCGTVFQQRVWAALRQIPAGQSASYGELARRLGTSPRAVGRANATNPVCVIIPCHRVIGADGSLTGFAFGEPLKQRLLEHERTFVGAVAASA